MWVFEEGQLVEEVVPWVVVVLVGVAALKQRQSETGRVGAAVAVTVAVRQLHWTLDRWCRSR